MLTQAEQRIGYVYSFLERPEHFSEEDWMVWRPIIARSCVQVMNIEMRNKGLEAIRFFNFYFNKKCI